MPSPLSRGVRTPRPRRRRRTALIAVLLGAFALLVQIASPSPAGATLWDYTAHNDPSLNLSWTVARGLNGTMWIGTAFGIARCSPSGTYTFFAGPANQPLGTVWDMALGPDGNVWFTHTDSPTNRGVGRITPAGVVTYLSDPQVTPAKRITRGHGNTMYFSSGDHVGRIAVGGTNTVTTWTDPAIHSIFDVTAGPNGRIWFTDNGNHQIGRLDPATGTITLFDTLGSSPHGNVLYNPDEIARGPDGRLWFTAEGGPYIGRITTSGVVTDFALTVGTVTPTAESIARGTDGRRMWFTTGVNTHPLGSITTGSSPTVQLYEDLDDEFTGPTDVSMGPGQNPWFVAFNTLGTMESHQ